MIKGAGDRLVPLVKRVLSQKKLEELFEKTRVGTRELKVDVMVNPAAARIPMRLTPMPEGGESLDQMKNPSSIFQRLMRKFKSEPNSIVWLRTPWIPTSRHGKSQTK